MPTQTSQASPPPGERREDIRFSAKDTALREDVHNLASMVGELLREQGGHVLFDRVEGARRAAIRRREGDAAAGDELQALTRELSATEARNFVRAFSTYFQVVNTAEQVHRIRRRRDYLKDASTHQPGGVEDTVFRLREEGLGIDAVRRLLEELCIEPVFTPHPTEPTRRTILRKQQNIVRRLIDMQNPALTPQEQRANFAGIRDEVTTIWQTEETPPGTRTSFDELEHVLFFLTDVIYRAVPAFYESLAEALEAAYGDAAADVRIPTILRFASWIGGDMDARPETTARTIRETLARQRKLVLDLYYNECRALAEKLSQGRSRIGANSAVLRRIDDYAGHFPNAAGSLPVRHRDMPYRSFLRLIMRRLKSTYDDDVYPYESPDELRDDLELIARSLVENKGRHAGLFPVRRLIRRVQTFGFHFVTVDIRQNALVNRRVVGRCLGEADWLAKSPEERARRIHDALERNESPIVELDNESRRDLAVFQAIAFCRRRYGARAIGPYIVSMAHGIDDVLSVILLARWGELRKRNGAVPLDIAPFFETVEDVASGARTMELLLQDPIYREHLRRRRDRQTVMVSYSDSNQDSGIAAARWSVQQAQAGLVEVLDAAGVELTLFHGRGGTISRGGGKTHAAVLGSPPGAVRGRLRATEQGELVNAKYGLRGIALRTLEQAVGSVALATALPRRRAPQEGAEWERIMQRVADASRDAYKALVDDGADDFFAYFRAATPVDVIERMQAERALPAPEEKADTQHLRGVPWDFAWNQSRCMLPGWFGFGSGIALAIDEYGPTAIRDMAEQWPFFRALLSDVETVLAKADLDVAGRYSALAGPLHGRFFPVIEAEFERCTAQLLTLQGEQVLLETTPTLRRSIRLRNPYVDPMSLLQVELLARWRAGGREDPQLFEALVASVNGIAQGLQDSG